MEWFKRQLVVAASIIVTYLVAGTLFFHYAEGWRLVDAFYFSGITLTTVGYGDFTPTHDLSKIVAVFYALSGVGIVFYSASVIARHYFEQEEEHLQRIWQNAQYRNAKLRERGQALHDERKRKMRASIEDVKKSVKATFGSIGRGKG